MSDSSEEVQTKINECIHLVNSFEYSKSISKCSAILKNHTTTESQKIQLKKLCAFSYFQCNFV